MDSFKEANPNCEFSKVQTWSKIRWDSVSSSNGNIGKTNISGNPRPYIYDSRLGWLAKSSRDVSIWVWGVCHKLPASTEGWVWLSQLGQSWDRLDWPHACTSCELSVSPFPPHNTCMPHNLNYVHLGIIHSPSCRCASIIINIKVSASGIAVKVGLWGWQTKIVQILLAKKFIATSP